MKLSIVRRLAVTLVATRFLTSTGTPPAGACARAVYFGKELPTVTGGTMNWFVEVGTHMWAFPREMPCDGGTGSNAYRWTGKCGSVVVSVFDGATADGMNEKGYRGQHAPSRRSRAPTAGGE